MSKKKKPSDYKKIEVLEVVDNSCTFKAFFSKMLVQGSVRVGQENEIMAFFKDLGLRDKETEDKYLEFLSKY